MKSESPILFDNSYLRLGEEFSRRQLPTVVQDPQLIHINYPLANYLGIDSAWLASDASLQALAGNTTLPGSDPIATVYAGHQFGSWNPQLGDGRAILLGEVVASDGKRFDLQLKGSGQTPFSRMGDGRSPLGPVLREYLVSEAMATLGVATTRSLAAVTTGERVFREGALPGAILTRVASSHIRVGTFQFFAARDNTEAVKKLADHVLQRHCPEALDAANPYLSLLQQVIERQAKLIAQWQGIGFIHGVMNTDNMLICGETVDYGPCAFMDTYHPETVYSSIDHHGRYAYHNQPAIAHWNLAWFAQSLMPLLDTDEERALQLAQQAIETFMPACNGHYQQLLANKLGLREASEQSATLAAELLQLMSTEKLDFTLTFRRLADLADPAAGPGVEALLQLPASLDRWRQRWQDLVAQQNLAAAEVQALMYRHNPALIPRNHLVEEAIFKATYDQDFSYFERLLEVSAKPFDYVPELAKYATPPTPEQVVRQTFCGT